MHEFVYYINMKDLSATNGFLAGLLSKFVLTGGMRMDK